MLLNELDFPVWTSWTATRPRECIAMRFPSPVMKLVGGLKPNVMATNRSNVHQGVFFIITVMSHVVFAFASSSGTTPRKADRGYAAWPHVSRALLPLARMPVLLGQQKKGETPLTSEPEICIQYILYSTQWRKSRHGLSLGHSYIFVNSI